MNNKYTEFFRYFLVSLFILLIGISSFNAMVDYTGVFGSNLFSREILLKTDNRRLVTPGVIRSYKPDTIITGTSRVGRGIDPTHSVFENQRTLNLFLNAGDAYEIAQLLNFASMVSPPKQVILGIDFFSFDEDLDVESYSNRFRDHNYSDNSLLFRWFRNIDLLVSKDAIKENRASLRRINSDFIEYSKKSFHDASPQKLDISLLDDTYSKAIQVYNLVKPDGGGHGYRDFRFSSEKLNALIQALEQLKNQGVEIKVFLSPVHVYFLEAIFQLGLFPDYTKILFAMSKISEDPLIEFYDFSGFNEVTSGKEGSKVSGHYPDAGHYSFKLGNRILEIIFKKTEINTNNFGKLVSSDNLLEHLNNFERERLIWRTQYPHDAKIIDSIIKSRNEKIDKSEIMKLVIREFYEPQITSSNNLPLMTKYCDEDQSMAYVEAGEFLMGSVAEEALENSLPLHKVELGSFCIDVHEVTNFDFQKVGMTLHEKTPEKFNNNYQPVVNINWLQAQKFCQINGKRLPTEEEWEKAARGIDGRRFPWGNNWPNCQLANFNGDPGHGCGTSVTSNVGTKISGISPYGLLDMAGNVLEFVDVSYPDYNTTNADQIIKGGGWSSEFHHLPISYRRITGIDFLNTNIGFRCAKNIEIDE